MNLAELERKLLAAARRNPPGNQVPYAFEKRIIAHIQTQPAPDEWALWARALWRAAAACTIITILSGALALLSPGTNTPNDLAEDFENTLLAGVNQDTESPQ